MLREKERSLGLWVPLTPSPGMCPALPVPGPLLFPGIESPLSPAPSQGSRYKVLPPDLLCPGMLQGSSCPIPAINCSCPSWDTEDAQRLTRTLPPCPGAWAGSAVPLSPGAAGARFCSHDPLRPRDPFPVLPQPPFPRSTCSRRLRAASGGAA